MDERKSPCSTGPRPLTIDNHAKHGNRVSLTTYCPWATYSPLYSPLSGESETSCHRTSVGSEMTDSTVSTGSAFHSPAKFTSAFSSSSFAVTVTAFDARFSPPPTTTHADPFINATSPVLAPPNLDFPLNHVVVDAPNRPSEPQATTAPGASNGMSPIS